jgi:hypothetical protein
MTVPMPREVASAIELVLPPPDCNFTQPADDR